MYYEKRRKRWRVVWTPGGEQRKTRSFETEREAKEFEARLQLGIVLPSEAASPTFDDLAARWVKEYCQVEKSETQWVADRRQIELHLSPSFGKVRVAELKKHHLMAVKAEMREKKAFKKKHALSPKTINNAIALAKKIMAWAVDQEMVARNPFKDVKRLRVPKQDYDWWDRDELLKFVEHVQPHDPELARLVAVAWNTGLRRGELAALTGASLDFKRRKIRVSASYSVELGKLLPTKNKSVDDLPMNEAVVSALEPKRFLKASDPVFPRELFPDLCHRFQAWCEDAGVKVLRVHDLRHSFASNLAAAGVAATTIQGLMRHKSLQMTERYMHLSPDHFDGATDVLCTQPARKNEEILKSGAPRGT